MAAPDQTRTFRFAGKLISGPTSLSAPFPYGGTVLGAMKQCEFLIGRTAPTVIAEEFREPADKLYGHVRATLRGFVRQWDTDAILAMFPDAKKDADGRPLISSPGTIRAGQIASPQALKLLLAADDPINNPSVLFYNAIAEVDADESIAFSSVLEAAIYVEWTGLRDSSSRIYQVGYLARMSL